MQKLAIGCVFYNNSTLEVSRYFKGLVVAARCAGIECEIYFIDNGDQQTEIPSHDVSTIACYRVPTQGNIGFGAAHNVLMRKAFEGGCSAYIATNPDGTFHYDCIASLLKLHALYPSALIEAIQFPEEHPKTYDEVTLETSWASGCCLFITKEIFGTCGGFDEGFFMYCEDVDLSWRARLAGYLVLTCPFALYYHHVVGRQEDTLVNTRLYQSGRYLGHKWGGSLFQQRCEDVLSDANVVLEPLPPLSTEDQLRSEAAKRIADFQYMFHFSEARW